LYLYGEGTPNLIIYFWRTSSSCSLAIRSFRISRSRYFSGLHPCNQLHREERWLDNDDRATDLQSSHGLGRG
jgi:hypothetical protein